MPEQLDMPFAIDRSLLTDFLNRATVIEDEQDRLRELLRQLREEYHDTLPLRGVQAALKIVRTREKMLHHHKEPMERTHFALLEVMVEEHVLGIRAALERLTQDAESYTVTLSADAVKE